MAKLDLESIKRRENIHQIAQFSSYTKPTKCVRFKYRLRYGQPVEYLATVAGKETLITQDVQEAVNYYNDIYTQIRE
jgi:hypothetical protein